MVPEDAAVGPVGRTDEVQAEAQQKPRASGFSPVHQGAGSEHVSR